MSLIEIYGISYSRLLPNDILYPAHFTYIDKNWCKDIGEGVGCSTRHSGRNIGNTIMYYIIFPENGVCMISDTGSFEAAALVNAHINDH